MHDIIIISSLKPLEDDEYSKFQIQAVNSWKEIAPVYLFNSVPDLAKGQGILTRPYGIVAPDANPPTLKQMLSWVSPDKNNAPDGIVILVNGDISLTKDVLGSAKIGESLGRIWAATSFRHETHEGVNNGVVDMGLDCFVLPRAIAGRMASEVPEFLTLGRGLWDNWVNGWLRHNLPPQRYFDITDWECVFHPKHERPIGRLSGYTEQQSREVLEHPSISRGGIPHVKYLKQ